MKTFFSIGLLLFTAIAAFSQARLTDENIRKDSIIKADIIDPAVHDAQGEAPDWKALATEITQKYDVTYADRTVTKGVIYFSYGKDWPTFTAAIVKYTVKYEPKDNLKLLNKNARFIMQYSIKKQELQTALGWSKLTVDKDPTNEDYKKTFDSLTAKIAGN